MVITVLTTTKIVLAIYCRIVIVISKIVSLLYGQVKEQVDNMQHARQYLSNDIQALKNKISILDATAFSCEQDSGEKNNNCKN